MAQQERIVGIEPTSSLWKSDMSTSLTGSALWGRMDLNHLSTCTVWRPTPLTSCGAPQPASARIRSGATG